MTFRPGLGCLLVAVTLELLRAGHKSTAVALVQWRHDCTSIPMGATSATQSRGSPVSMTTGCGCRPAGLRRAVSGRRHRVGAPATMGRIRDRHRDRVLHSA